MAESIELDTLQSSQLKQEPKQEREVTNRVSDLSQSDQTFYNLMTVEVWSIAKTMDELQPGFWAEYMRNRQTIAQQQMQERRHQEATKITKPPLHRASSREPSPALHVTKSPTPERVSVFSQDLERDLPLLQRSLRPALKTNSATAVKPSVLPDLISVLPHLVQFPVVKVLPSPLNPVSQTPKTEMRGMVTVGVACWLTSHFLVATSETNPASFALQKRDALILQPGQVVICELGFQLNDLCSMVQVRLVKSLQSYLGLTATWAAKTFSPDDTSLDFAPAEAAIQLVNQSDRPCRLQAGQAFCRLEFYCPAANLPHLSLLEVTQPTSLNPATLTTCTP